MKHIALFVLCIIICGCAMAVPQSLLKKGMVIAQSTTITKNTYTLNADTSLQTPLITIVGKNITVDFNNAILQGSNDKDMPNLFYGLAVMVAKGSENITIINANISGFKIAVMADSVEGLHIYNSDFSYNYRQQLHSNWQREDISDWMSYHHNENGEWKRYGAGIYLTNCNHAVVKGNTVTNAQCGLMMTRCSYAEVNDNNFSYNSALGIGMYSSSNNKVYGNILNFNVRGYSHGIYNRGQDSGGILVFEQCNNNVFAYNTATHSGDGFFLWAGQTTMDNGKGGCNDNLLYGNDFSYAPTNGVELTFSRNDIVKNIINECDNGIWGGYSYYSKVYGNIISGNRTGIAIEHGQGNEIWYNRFERNNTSIKLWSNKSQPSDWGYAKYRDTRSRNYKIYANQFNWGNVVYDIMGTDSVWLAGNHKYENKRVYKIGERMGRLDSTLENGRVEISEEGATYDSIIAKLKTTSIPAIVNREGRGQIRITPWGPYNFKYPYVFLQKVDSAGLYHFEVMHDGGEWKVVWLNGFTIVKHNNDSLVASVDSTVEQRTIQLQYNGRDFTDVFGKQHPANKTYLFSYDEFDAHPQWKINFYKWDSMHAADKDYNVFFNSLQTPVYSLVSDKVDYTWWGAVGKGQVADSFATVATTTMDLPGREYEISVTGDDLVKLFIDGKPVIDAWDKHNVDLDENTNHTIRMRLDGSHTFKIVHAEIGGLATLMFYLRPLTKS